MNVAFPALLIFALILPGSVCRYSYARGPWGWANPTSMRTISDELAYSVIIAVGLHVCWLELASLLGYQVDSTSLLALLTGHFGQNSTLFASAVASIADHKGRIATYFLSLYVGSAFLGWSAHWLVRTLHLDHRAAVLRFENRWWYLLTGEILAIEDGYLEEQLPDGVYASAVVELGKEAFLYWGIVEDFAFDESGELDRFVLSLAHRRRLANDRSPEEMRAVTDFDSAGALPIDGRFYEVRGDFLIIRYSDIRTLNLDYFWLDEDVEVNHPDMGDLAGSTERVSKWRDILPLRV